MQNSSGYLKLNYKQVVTESLFVVAFLVSSLLGACFANGWRNFDPCAWSLASEALSFADLAALLHLDISGQLTGSETTQVFDWTGFDEPGKPR